MTQGFLILLLVVIARSAPAGEPLCLKYEPEVVTLSGAVLYRTFSDAAGRPERVPLLLLDSPICVEASGSDFNLDEGDELVVHLNINPDRLPRTEDSAGPRITATGTLYHRHTSHHHADLVLMVSDLKAVP